MIKQLFLFLSVFFLVLNAGAQSGSNDPTFNPSDIGCGYGAGVNNIVNASVLQPDGKIIIVGAFTAFENITQNRIARLNPDGSLDTGFNPGGTGANATVTELVLQPDGKIIIGGLFTQFNGVARSCLTRLNANGTLDPTFNTGAGTLNASVGAIALQPDGKIIIGGTFSQYNGMSRSKIARLHADGSLDLSFVPGTGVTSNGFVQAVALQPDGKIIIGGRFTTFNGVERKQIARLNPEGTLDMGFTSGVIGNGSSIPPPSSISAILIQPDGKILFAGDFAYFNNSNVNNVARANPDGSLDTTLTPFMIWNVQTSTILGGGANAPVNALAMQPDGKILIGGSFAAFNTTTRYGIIRINTDNTPDTAFNAESETAVLKTITVQPDGKFFVGGDFSGSNGATRNYMSRLNTNGSLDTDFYRMQSGANGRIRSISPLPGGKTIIAGDFTVYNQSVQRGLARLNTDGGADSTFSSETGPDGTVYTTLTLPNGKIIVGGNFFSYNGINKKYLVCIHPDGSLDTGFTFPPGIVGPVMETALQPDGKILVGGQFYINGNQPRGIFRVNTDGSLDPGFTARAVGGYVGTILQQPDGKIIICGNFIQYDGVTRNRIARINSDGSLDTGFNPGGGANGAILCGALQPDGKIIIGGEFSSYNGSNRRHIARLNSNGSLDTDFTPGTGTGPITGNVNTLLLQPDGKTIIGGIFTSYNGVTQNRIARLNTNGLLDNSFAIGTGVNDDVEAMVLLSNGSIILGGNFTGYNEICRTRIARLNNCSNTTGSITIASCTDYTWYGNTYSNSGNYTHTLSNAAGCDSIITLYLTIGTSTSDTLATACNSFAWHGNSYSSSGNYTHTFTNANGCDSVVTLHLTVNTSTAGDTVATACNSFTWYGNTYNSSGDYTHTLTNATGCDSTVTLHLNINSVSVGDTAATTCDSFTWYGNTYSSSGNYTHTLTNATGCDSMVTLHLTINNSVTGDTSATACDSFTWYGNTYSSGGDYTHTLNTGNGCDSTITLHLTIDTLGCDSVLTLPLIPASPTAVVYPNPNTGSFNVSLPKGWTGARVIISEINGTQVLNYQASVPTFPIQLQVQPGLYIIRLVNNGEIVSKTFIIL